MHPYGCARKYDDAVIMLLVISTCTYNKDANCRYCYSDTVHKEMEKLSDDLQAAHKRVSALESALQASREEQRATALQVSYVRVSNQTQ